MNNDSIEEYRLLKNNGVEVQDKHVITPHRGDETEIHYHAKCATALIGKHNGYIANCECPVPRGEIDVLLYGNSKRLSYAVEVEHSPTTENRSVKLQKYVRETPVDELIMINANNLSPDVLEMHRQIRERLGL